MLPVCSKQCRLNIYGNWKSKESGCVTMPEFSKLSSLMKKTSDKVRVPNKVSRRFSLGGKDRRETIVGGLFVTPALVMYAIFVLVPLVLSVYYSFFRWNGITPMTWVGLKNYRTVFGVPDLFATIINAFKLVLFFSIIPVGLGLIVASVIQRVGSGRFGSVVRTVLFLPQVIPLVAAGIIWGWLLALPGLINEMLTAVGLENLTRAWLGDFTWALPSVGMIGVWVLLGFCTVLLSTGITKIDPSLYESARIDGANWLNEFLSITVPLLKYEIGVCLTVTIINALSAFDIVYVSTAGGPGNSTAVPGVKIYILAFTEQRIGLASALAVLLMILVLLVVLPLQRLNREEE
jgi:raffinose/stachyose/melibiose transport system permease protein